MKLGHNDFNSEQMVSVEEQVGSKKGRLRLKRVFGLRNHPILYEVES